MRHALITLILTTLLIAPAFAQSQKTITLQDGSSIQGTVVGLQNGTYTIKTPSMGQITIPENDITSISTASATPARKIMTDRNILPDVNALQSQIMSNPALMQEIAGLIADPKIMQLLSDPTFIEMIQSGNGNAIKNNPKTDVLMKNPKVKRLMEKISANYSQE